MTQRFLAPLVDQSRLLDHELFRCRWPTLPRWPMRVGSGRRYTVNEIAQVSTRWVYNYRISDLSVPGFEPRSLYSRESCTLTIRPPRPKYTYRCIHTYINKYSGNPGNMGELTFRCSSHPHFAH